MAIERLHGLRPRKQGSQVPGRPPPTVSMAQASAPDFDFRRLLSQLQIRAVGGSEQDGSLAVSRMRRNPRFARVSPQAKLILRRNGIRHDFVKAQHGRARSHQANGGPARVYYALTDMGRERLGPSQTSWPISEKSRSCWLPVSGRWRDSIVGFHAA